jgi:hypothetical protein
LKTETEIPLKTAKTETKTAISVRENREIAFS